MRATPDNLLDDIFNDNQKPIKDSVLEKAYMGEHVNIQPPEKPRKRLTLHEQIFYEYIKSHPNYTMPGTCRDLKNDTMRLYENETTHRRQRMADFRGNTNKEVDQ